MHPIHQSQRPRSIRYELSSLARTLGSWVRIPLEAWISVCVHCVYVVLCVVSGLEKGWSPAQGVLPTVYRNKKLKKAAKAQKGLWSHNNKSTPPYDLHGLVLNPTLPFTERKMKLWTNAFRHSVNLLHGAQPFLRSRQSLSYSRTSLHFMEPKDSLPCSQEPSKSPYPKPDQSNPYHPIVSL
jgi:hypothetical protein